MELLMPANRTAFRAWIIGTAVALVGPSGVGLDAQVIEVSNDVACVQCRVQLQLIATLGESDGPGLIEVGARGVRVDGRGRYWVLDGAEPLVFDSAGVFRGRLGRRGAGPGEYARAVDAVPLPGDSVLVVDAELRRGSVVTRDLSFARSFSLSTAFFAMVPVDWPRAIVINAEVRTSQGSGWPLHRVSLTSGFEVGQSFGPGNGEVRPYGFPQISQVLWGEPNGASFWSGDQMRYRISEWSADGRLLRQLTRRPSWFGQPSSTTMGSPDTPPQPGIAAIQVVGRSQLWVFSRVPAVGWRDAWPKANEGQREFEYRSLSLERLFTSRIDVLEVSSGRLLAEAALDDWVIASLPGRRFATYTVDAAGIPRVRIYRFAVEGLR